MKLIDELGACKAAIATLQADEERLKARVIAQASKGKQASWAADGELFRASVVWGTKTTTDWKAVADALGVDINPDTLARLIHNHTRTSPPAPTVRVCARKVTA